MRFTQEESGYGRGMDTVALFPRGTIWKGRLQIQLYTGAAVDSDSGDARYYVAVDHRTKGLKSQEARLALELGDILALEGGRQVDPFGAVPATFLSKVGPPPRKRR